MKSDNYWGEICGQIDKVLKIEESERRKLLKKNCGDNPRLFTDCSSYLSFIETAEKIDFLAREIELHSKLFSRLTRPDACEGERSE